MVYLFPLLTVLIWSGNAIVNKMAASAIEPSAMSFYRWALAAAVLTPFCLAATIKQRHIILAHLGKIFILALLGMGLYQTLGYYAALTTSASNMALITSLVPMFSVFLSVPLLGSKLHWRSLLGAVISLAGLSYMLGEGDILFFIRQEVTEGDTLMLIGAIFYATYGICLKRWKMPFSNWTLVYVQCVFAVMMLTPLWLSSDRLLATSAAYPLIAYAGIAASIFAPWLWVKSITHIGADSSAMFMNLLPVFALALAALLLGEVVKLYHIIGALLVIAGVLLTQLKVKKRQLRAQNITN